MLTELCEESKIQSLGELSQKNFEEIKERMAKEHAAVVGTLSKTIRDQQQIIENMDSKISRQSYVLARLNQERDETANELKAKDQRILKRTTPSSSAIPPKMRLRRW